MRQALIDNRPNDGMKPTNRLLPLAALLLAGCAHTAPAIEVRTVTVDRIVTASCVRADQIPAEPEMIGPRLTGDASRDNQVLAASAIRLRAWGRTAVALLGGCVLAE